MESIVKKLFLIGSAALAVAVTLTSISTQAFECDAAGEAAGTCSNDYDETKPLKGMSSTFSFQIAEAINLTGVAGGAVVANSLESINTTAPTGEANSITAQVYSNVPFQISLSAADDKADGNLRGTKSGNTAVIEASSTLTPGTTAAWGIQKLDINKNVVNGYSPLLKAGTVFYSSYNGTDKSTFKPAAGKADTTNPDNILGEDFAFPFGVTITPSTPADTYSTTVKVTVSYGE